MFLGINCYINQAKNDIHTNLSVKPLKTQKKFRENSP